MPIDYTRRLEAARLAAGQCAGDPKKFSNMAEAIYAFLTAGETTTSGNANPPAPLREHQS